MSHEDRLLDPEVLGDELERLERGLSRRVNSDPENLEKGRELLETLRGVARAHGPTPAEGTPPLAPK